MRHVLSRKRYVTCGWQDCWPTIYRATSVKRRFADHRHFDLAGIGQLLLEGLGDVAADFGGLDVVGVLGAGDDAQFAAGLDGEGLLDAGEAAGDRFQLFHPLDVAFERFAAGAGREALQASAAATSTV